MAGGIAMLRVLPDPAARENVLAMLRSYYLRTFAGC
jgi:hypothetical protein